MHPLEAEIDDEGSPALLADELLDVSIVVMPDSVLDHVLGEAVEAGLHVYRLYHPRLLYSVPESYREFYGEDVLALAEAAMLVVQAVAEPALIGVLDAIPELAALRVDAV